MLYSFFYLNIFSPELLQLTSKMDRLLTQLSTSPPPVTNTDLLSSILPNNINTETLPASTIKTEPVISPVIRTEPVVSSNVKTEPLVSSNVKTESATSSS